MKKNYVYFIAPLAALAIFIAIFLKYDAGYEAKHQQIEKERIAAKQRKIDEENRNKLKAVEEALAQQEIRKKAKAEKEAKDQAEKEARMEAAQKRDRAREESRKLAERVRDTKKEVDEAKKEIEKIEEDKKQSIAEEAFLREYVKKAEANAQGLTQVLEKIDAADKQREANARAAAAAATAKK